MTDKLLKKYEKLRKISQEKLEKQKRRQQIVDKTRKSITKHLGIDDIRNAKNCKFFTNKTKYLPFQVPNCFNCVHSIYKSCPKDKTEVKNDQ